jgi:hypothetical protein
MMLPFLQYINNKSQKWYSCFGVHYATYTWQVADASSLNGLYKIEPAMAKHKYIEHRDVPRFEPTDIVPLVNIAFLKSFGTKKSALKAISERGWNPLNYNILMTIPCLAKDVVDLTTEAESQAIVTNDPIKTLPTLNINRGVDSYYLDRLFEEERKREGRKKKFKKIKSDQKTKRQKTEHLKKLTKVSSTTLAANNHYTLDATVLEMVADNTSKKKLPKRQSKIGKGG